MVAVREEALRSQHSKHLAGTWTALHAMSTVPRSDSWQCNVALRGASPALH